MASALLGVEARRAGLTAGPVQAVEVERDLTTVDLLPIDAAVLARAGALEPPAPRTLDAIHIATALSLGEDLGVFVAYDERLLEAARTHGLPVASPA